MFAFFWSVIGILGWSYLSSLLFWFGLRLLFSDRFWWLALLNTFAPYLFLPIVILLPLAFWSRKRRLLIGLILGCLLFGVLFPPRLNFPTTARRNTLLRVMTFNLLWSNQDYPKITQVVQKMDADVVGIQELQPKELPNLLKAISPIYPYYAIHPADRFHTVALFSRLPIESVKPLLFPPIERGLQAIVRYGDQRINVLVTHLTPNNIPLNQLVSETIDRYTRRAAETEFLKKFIPEQSLPTIMLCDCNMTDSSETYYELRKVLKDSFEERGQGTGHTLVSSIVPFAVQRLDYVWHTGELQSIESFVGADGGSDHLPVIASFRVP
ncbi:endonuclease/exonuclease/phosphatase family protein [Leptolyngbya sp. AN03gr2]|uniref:endonuclease/exonuclease/phosphatase family protein n=1 Tax=unclassified Leptolyngbya TaxID=2650499 RepID=UPI003D31F905